MNERSKKNDVTIKENFLTVNKHAPADYGWRSFETKEKDKFKMRTFTKHTHQFSEMQHDTGDSAADSILFVAFLTIASAIGATIVSLTNTYIQ